MESSRTANDRDLRGRKHCLLLERSCLLLHIQLISVLLTVLRDFSEHSVGKKSRQENWEQTPVSRLKDNPDPLPDMDVVVHSDRIDNFERIILERGFVRV